MSETNEEDSSKQKGDKDGKVGGSHMLYPIEEYDDLHGKSVRSSGHGRGEYESVRHNLPKSTSDGRFIGINRQGLDNRDDVVGGSGSSVVCGNGIGIGSGGGGALSLKGMGNAAVPSTNVTVRKRYTGSYDSLASLRSGVSSLSVGKINSGWASAISGATELSYQKRVAVTNKIGAQRTSRTQQKLKLLPHPQDNITASSQNNSHHLQHHDVKANVGTVELNNKINVDLTGKALIGDNENPTSSEDDEINVKETVNVLLKSPGTLIRDFAIHPRPNKCVREQLASPAPNKADRDSFPRVTAYCTVSQYRLDLLLRHFKTRRCQDELHVKPLRFDECIYTPLVVEDTIDSKNRLNEPLIDISNGVIHPDFDTSVHVAEAFIFDYGTVVLWGLTAGQEQRFLNQYLLPFAVGGLEAERVQIEEFNFYYIKHHQARIYNDFFSLRDKHNYMMKLALSHALSQSVKTSYYEVMVHETIEECKHLPAQIALTGRVALTRRQIHMCIGRLFLVRIGIHQQGSVLDAPEVMWTQPRLDPAYQAVRSYLEIDRRVGLLTDRLAVIGDLLLVLKDQLSQSHDEYLEWIVIILIAVEILIAALSIVVDFYGVRE